MPHTEIDDFVYTQILFKKYKISISIPLSYVVWSIEMSLTDILRGSNFLWELSQIYSKFRWRLRYISCR